MGEGLSLKRRILGGRRMKITLAGAGALGEKHVDPLALIEGVEFASRAGRTRVTTQAVAWRYGVGDVTTELAEDWPSAASSP
jgi:predicted homoserine dehydrogenase-like protein